MSEERLTIDFGDGVSALERVMRAITMISDGAIGTLIDLGWTRSTVNMEIDQDEPLPCWVTIRKRRVFEVDYGRFDDGRIEIVGKWIVKPRRPGLIDRIRGV